MATFARILGGSALMWLITACAAKTRQPTAPREGEINSNEGKGEPTKAQEEQKRRAKIAELRETVDRYLRDSPPPPWVSSPPPGHLLGRSDCHQNREMANTEALLDAATQILRQHCKTEIELEPLPHGRKSQTSLMGSILGGLQASVGIRCLDKAHLAVGYQYFFLYNLDQVRVDCD